MYGASEFSFLRMLTLEQIGTKVLKCVEGQFNKAFILTMDDGQEVVVRIPNPNAGPEFFTIASEVATRNFVRTYYVLDNPLTTAKLRPRFGNY